MKLIIQLNIDEAMNVEINVPEEIIAGVLCTAIENSCGYWARVISEQPSPKSYIAEKYLKYFHGGSTHFGILNEEGTIEGDYVLDREAIKSGIKIMAEFHSGHLGDFMMEDCDAETADVFLQCCLFGETMFGQASAKIK